MLHSFYSINKMEKEFVPYEVALELKELGFNEPCASCYGSYSHKKNQLFLNINNPINIETLLKEKTGFNKPSFYVKAPTFSQSFRWFKEKHGVFSNVWDFESDKKFFIDWGFGIHTFKVDTFNDMREEYLKLECLKKLIEIIKSKTKLV